MAYEEVVELVGAGGVFGDGPWGGGFQVPVDSGDRFEEGLGARAQVEVGQARSGGGGQSAD